MLCCSLSQARERGSPGRERSPSLYAQKTERLRVMRAITEVNAPPSLLMLQGNALRPF